MSQWSEVGDCQQGWCGMPALECRKFISQSLDISSAKTWMCIFMCLDSIYHMIDIKVYDIKVYDWYTHMMYVYIYMYIFLHSITYYIYTHTLCIYIYIVIAYVTFHTQQKLVYCNDPFSTMVLGVFEEATWAALLQRHRQAGPNLWWLECHASCLSWVP